MPVHIVESVRHVRHANRNVGSEQSPELEPEPAPQSTVHVVGSSFA
jgi:hypothetical protein